MASNIYTQHTVGGGSHLAKRSTKQGCPIKPTEIKKVYKMTMVTPQGKKAITAKAKAAGMSYSAYVELAGTLFSI